MTQNFDSIYEHVTNTLAQKGLPAAVRVITRIYEESDKGSPNLKCQNTRGGAEEINVGSMDEEGEEE